MKHVLPTFVLLCILTLLLRMAPSSGADTTTPAVPDLARLKSLYSEKCSACHNLYDPTVEVKTRQQWQRTVTRMLVKYKASDEITPPEAASIVDYLSTFAPKDAVLNTRPGPPSANGWATDAGDVWPGEPVRSRAVNFVGPGSLSSLSPLSAGAAGPAAIWRVAGPAAQPDAQFVKVRLVGANPARFAVLLDPKGAGRDVDVRVRFQVIGGKSSPSVGIVFGASDAANYYVLRCDAKAGTLSVLKMAGATHTALQVTPLNGEAPPAPVALTPSPSPKNGRGGPENASFSPSPVLGGGGRGVGAMSSLAPGWHTLRLMARSGFLRGWIDMQKRVSVHDDTYTGGQVGLWAQGDTIAAFNNWTTDIYTTQ